jgi:predicted DNA-binding antitoxin AbrB/MazE fold protein
MSKKLEALYENGVLRPLEPLDLREHQRVTVVVSEEPVTSPEEEWWDVECWQQCATEADESIRLEAVREALSKIPGSLTADFIAEREDR